MRNLKLIGVLFGVVAVSSGSTAWAGDISFLDTFGNIDYQQTGNGNTLSLNGSFFSADLNSTVANAYTSASFTPAGGSPIALTQSTPTVYHYQSGLYADLPSMEADFPFGIYSFSGVNGPNTDTSTLDYEADDYPQSNPYLTGTNYSDLQGMDSSQNFTFNFSPFVAGGAPNETNTFTFLTIYDYTTATTVFDAGFLPSTTTSVLLPGGTLTPGNSYDYELDYSDRVSVTGDSNAEFAPELGFDIRADGTFTTATSATPEPGSSLLLAAGLGGILILGLRRKLSA